MWSEHFRIFENVNVRFHRDDHVVSAPASPKRREAVKEDAYLVGIDGTRLHRKDRVD